MASPEQLSRTLEYAVKNIYPNDALPEYLLERDRKENLDVVFDLKANQVNTDRPHVVARFLQEPEFDRFSTYEKAQLLRKSLINTALMEEHNISEWGVGGVRESSLQSYDRFLQLAAAIHAMYTWRKNGKNQNFTKDRKYPDGLKR